ncbi:unnamed protein product [Cercospora beticola]|nr:unnamed protein product [Cercospora beticola]
MQNMNRSTASSTTTEYQSLEKQSYIDRDLSGTRNDNSNHASADAYTRVHIATATSTRYIDESTARMRNFEEEWLMRQDAEIAATAAAVQTTRITNHVGFRSGLAKGGMRRLLRRVAAMISGGCRR